MRDGGKAAEAPRKAAVSLEERASQEAAKALRTSPTKADDAATSRPTSDASSKLGVKAVRAASPSPVPPSGQGQDQRSLSPKPIKEAELLAELMRKIAALELTTMQLRQQQQTDKKERALLNEDHEATKKEMHMVKRELQKMKEDYHLLLRRVDGQNGKGAA